MIADVVTWLLLAQLVGEAEDACVEAGDVFVSSSEYEVPGGASLNPPPPGTPIYVHPPRPLAAIAHEAWTAIHEHLGVKLVDRPRVEDEIVRIIPPQGER